jgi:hypothetical protein
MDGSSSFRGWEKASAYAFTCEPQEQIIQILEHKPRIGYKEMEVTISCSNNKGKIKNDATGNDRWIQCRA